MLDIPIFLNQVMFVMFASAIPLLIMSFVLRLFIKSGKKTYKSLLK